MLVNLRVKPSAMLVNIAFDLIWDRLVEAATCAATNITSIGILKDLISPPSDGLKHDCVALLTL